MIKSWRFRKKNGVDFIILVQYIAANFEFTKISLLMSWGH